MELKQLQQRARSARDQSTRERLELIEKSLDFRTRQAEDRTVQRIRTAHEELLKHAQGAADLGKREAILVRLSSQLYDLRQAVLEELNSSLQRSPDPYPQLRKEGPFAFRDIDRWLRDLNWPDPEHTSPLAWLDKLAHWLNRAKKVKGLSKLLHGGPPLQSPLKELYAECKERKLSPFFDFYDQFEDRGIALKVSW